MVMRTAATMNALILLLLAAVAVSLFPRASMADGDDAAMDALFARIREVQHASKSELGELEKFNADAPQDLVRPAGVEPVAGDVDFSEAVAVDGDSAADLFAHIYEVQRKAQLANEEREILRGDESESGAMKGGVGDGEEEEEKEVEQVGVEDPSAQERFKELEAALKTLTGKVVDSKEEPGVPATQLNAPGLKGEDVINLLHKYAQEMHDKIYPKGVGQESHQDDDHSREADGGTDRGHGSNHDDHGHSHSHEHGQGQGHHHHDHGHEDAHANVGFSRASDAHYHNHDHSDHSHGHDHGNSIKKKKFVLPEEIAEEEDLLQYGFEGQVYSSAEQPSRWRGPDIGVWLRAMGCSLLVSLASLICLMLLPCIVSNGKPSETVVNALASFGAGAMLGDAFLHQLPHAFGNSGSSPHSHDAHDHGHGHSHSHSHDHDHSSAAGHGHAHSLVDLSIGLAVLGGILLFFIVEKIVRRYEELSNHGGQRALGHFHHHHQKKKDGVKKLEGPEKIAAVGEVSAIEDKESKSLESNNRDIKKRKSAKKKDSAAVDNKISSASTNPSQQVEASGEFVIGYLNLFSDAVHNFTDGMALGSAFLLHGPVGGWSRTLFLLAHELPQEVGDFGILVKSGFSVIEALAFNFLSALVALAGTAVALMLGGTTGHSSLIEGFIAGGFIYMSVGGVMPSMHDQGSSLISTLSQLVPMVLGMGVAVVISLAE